MAYQKVIIHVEVLFDDSVAIDPTELSLQEIAEEGIDGCYSIKTTHVSKDELTVEQLHAACSDHGTDPEFFLG